MNLLLCKNEWRIGNGDRFLIEEPKRISHILKILNKKPGDKIKAGLINESLGFFVLEEISNSGLTGRYRPLLRPKRRVPEVDLLIAINRPPTVRKILQLAGTWGVRSITFFPTKNSRREYLTSPVWKREETETELIEGMEQGKNVFLPEIKIEFRKNAETLFSQYETESRFSHSFVLDRKGNSLSSILAETGIGSGRSPDDDSSRSFLFVIGPESGLVPEEFGFWKRKGFSGIRVSKRILRTETAVAFLLSQLEF